MWYNERTSEVLAWKKELKQSEKKENLTGYNSEAWHFRYVGADVAKYIYENNITFDEYYALFIYSKKTNS